MPLQGAASARLLHFGVNEAARYFYLSGGWERRAHCGLDLHFLDDS